MALFRQTRMLLLFANIGIVLAVGVFMAGYFCPPPTLAFDHTLEKPVLEEPTLDDHVSQASTPFDKVVFMVIDALRRYDNLAKGSICIRGRSPLTCILSDFVYEEDSGFNFTKR